MMSIAPPNISINAKPFMAIQICVVAGTYATWIGVIVDIVVTGIVPSQLIAPTDMHYQWFNVCDHLVTK